MMAVTASLANRAMLDYRLLVSADVSSTKWTSYQHSKRRSSVLLRRLTNGRISGQLSSLDEIAWIRLMVGLASQHGIELGRPRCFMPKNRLYRYVSRTLVQQNRACTGHAKFDECDDSRNCHGPGYESLLLSGRNPEAGMLFSVIGPTLGKILLARTRARGFLWINHSVPISAIGRLGGG
jgi:hypothetical protein